MIDSERMVHPSMRRFLWIYLLWLIGVAGIRLFLENQLGIDLPTGAAKMLPVFMAALDAGARFVEQNRQAPTSSYSWRVSRRMLVVELLLYFGSFLAWITFMYRVAPESISQDLLLVMVGGILIQSLLAFLCNRVFFALGASRSLKKRP